MLQRVRELVVVDPDEERLAYPRPPLDSGQAHRVPVVSELAVSCSGTTAVGPDVQIEDVLAASSNHQPPPAAVWAELLGTVDRGEKSDGLGDVADRLWRTVHGGSVRQAIDTSAPASASC